MASKYWIKLYHELLDDPKMGMMPDKLWRRTIEIFLLAGEYDQAGLLPPVDQVAWRLRISTEECNETFQELLQCNILAQDDDGILTVKNFHKRQKAADSTERVKQFRERQAKKPDTGGQNNNNQGQNQPIQPQNNQTETRNEKNTVSACNESGNEDETKRYPDTDTESNININNAHAPAPDYLSSVLAHESGKAGISNPADDLTTHFGYRDQALKAVQELTGFYPDTQVGKPAIIALAQNQDFDLERWKDSIRSARLAGVRADNIQCFIDTYQVGGNYKDLYRNKNGANYGYSGTDNYSQGKRGASDHPGQGPPGEELPEAARLSPARKAKLDRLTVGGRGPDRS